jgi:hypothetical protein
MAAANTTDTEAMLEYVDAQPYQGVMKPAFVPGNELNYFGAQPYQFVPAATSVTSANIKANYFFMFT